MSPVHYRVTDEFFNRVLKINFHYHHLLICNSFYRDQINFTDTFIHSLPSSLPMSWASATIYHKCNWIFAFIRKKNCQKVPRVKVGLPQNDYHKFNTYQRRFFSFTITTTSTTIQCCQSLMNKKLYLTPVYVYFSWKTCERGGKFSQLPLVFTASNPVVTLIYNCCHFH